MKRSKHKALVDLYIVFGPQIAIILYMLFEHFDRLYACILIMLICSILVSITLDRNIEDACKDAYEKGYNAGIEESNR